MLGVEELANLAVAQPALAAEELLRVLPWYLGWPALLGLLGAGSRDAGGRAVVAVAGVWAVVWGAIAAMVFAERGLPLPAVLGFSLGAAAAVVGSAGALRLAATARARWALAVAGLVFLPAFRAVNLNAFGSPTDPGALRADGVILALALLAGGAAFLGGRRLARTGLVLAPLPLVLALGLRAALAPPPPGPAPAADRPDLVFIVIDTLRADHLGAWGHDRPTSPNLDALAARGVRYADAAAPTSWTLPSFASLHTGRSPGVHGAGVNPGERNTQAPLAERLPTLAEALADAGYRTGAIVSNPYLKASFGHARGFHHYDDALGLAHMMMMLHPVDQLPFRAMPDRYYRLAPRMVAAAEQWWARTEGGPRYLMLHLMDPHKPYNPTDEALAAIRAAGPADADGRPWDEAEREVVDLYDAEIRFMDEALGPFLDQLAADGAWVFVTADHGEEFMDHVGAYPDERWPPDVRHGHTLYQEQLHVPLIVAGPDSPPQVVARPVRSLDVVPTVLQLAGASPFETDGAVLAEALGDAGGADEIQHGQSIRYGTEKQSVRVGDLKLVRSQWGDELFDLAADPAELRNLADDRPADVAHLAEQLPSAEAAEGADEAEIDPVLLEQLKAVGYVDH